METNTVTLGKIILLNGASSSGKSSIACGLQARLDQPFWHISIDHLRDAGVLPLDRVRSGEFEWSEMRGPFFAGFERSLVVYANEGNNLIVEHIIEDEAWMQRVARLLQNLDVFFVGVRCDLGELEQRERQRGNRRLGDAKKDFFTVHGHAVYDVEVDTTSTSSDRIADRIIAAHAVRTKPSAFERIAASSF
ncbi:MAG: chloramphenicol phosphotransferase CPT family protein [Acidobacteriota bacterium]|nr:chloramphenicol phosphotransferase CPT family protein [Acidobacteriota bacterium]